MQIEGSDCHHGADELVGRCLALHQQRREEGQASGDAQVRKSSFNQLQMPWVSQHQRVSLLGREYQPLGRYIHGRLSLFPPPRASPFWGRATRGGAGTSTRVDASPCEMHLSWAGHNCFKSFFCCYFILHTYHIWRKASSLRSYLTQFLCRPCSKVVIRFLTVMMKHGYIGEFEVIPEIFLHLD